MINEIAIGTTVEVISEEQPARRFHAKVTNSGVRTRVGEAPVPWVHLGAGNGRWGLTVKLSDIDTLASSIRDMPGKLYIVLSEDVIDSARVERSRHPTQKFGRINAYDQFEIGELIRVYAKSGQQRHRVRPDWIVAATSTMRGSVTLSQDNGYKRYEPINVELSQMLRDVNGHMRAYIDDKQLVAAGLHRTYNEIAKREVHHMAMSHDRVEFNLGPFGTNTAGTAAVKAATEAFNLTDGEVASLYGFGPAIQFRVRPSQFARFLILRDAYGGTNDFKGLKAKLVAEEPPVVLVDAAKRDNRVTF